MNLSKHEIKNFCEFVEKQLKKKDVVAFSGWHTEPFGRMTSTAAGLYARARTYTFNEREYIISYSAARKCRGGMDEGSPETYTIKRLSKSLRLDVDNLLSSTEINVRHFHGGQPKGFEEPIPLNGVYDVLRVVRHFYEKTDLNIMIHRQSTGDVIVWVDEKRFQQR
jgi:hypothetical protein